jgi:hypothetical protein
MPLTTKDIRVNGYPPLDVVLAYFDAIPVLLEACKQHSPNTLDDWLAHLNVEPIATRVLHPVTPKAEQVLNPAIEVEG